jgi:hypothetical protein
MGLYLSNTKGVASLQFTNDTQLCKTLPRMPSERHSSRASVDGKRGISQSPSSFSLTPLNWKDSDRGGRRVTQREKLSKKMEKEAATSVCVCVSLFYVIDTGSIGPRARIKVTELGVTYLPSTFNSDAGYADLPLACRSEKGKP